MTRCQAHVAFGRVPTRDFITALRAGVRGEVLTTAGSIAPYARDFSRVPHRPPLVVVRAIREADVAHTLRTARDAGIHVAVRSAGHSCGGQTLAKSGVVLEHYRPGARLRMLPDDRVEVDASSRWFDVERALNRRGRTAPVLTDYLHLSVGGTLAVGGFGHRSVRQGCQVDHVERFRVVRQDGEAGWCAPAATPALGVAGLASLGRLGVITRVVLRTLPRPTCVEMRAAELSSLGELEGVLTRLAEEPGARPDYFCASMTERRIITRTGRACFERQAPSAENPSRWDFETHRHREIWLARFPAHRRVWVDYVLGLEGCLTFLRWLAAARRAGSLPSTLAAVYVLALERPRRRLPFSFDPATPGVETLVFSVGLYHMIAPGDGDGLLDARRFVRSALTRAITLGGRPYLYGWNPLGPADVARLAAEDETRLAMIGHPSDGDSRYEAGRASQRA